MSAVTTSAHLPVVSYCELYEDFDAWDNAVRRHLKRARVYLLGLGLHTGAVASVCKRIAPSLTHDADTFSNDILDLMSCALFAPRNNSFLTCHSANSVWVVTALDAHVVRHNMVTGDKKTQEIEFETFTVTQDGTVCFFMNDETTRKAHEDALINSASSLAFPQYYAEETNILVELDDEERTTLVLHQQYFTVTHAYEQGVRVESALPYTLFFDGLFYVGPTNEVYATVTEGRNKWVVKNDQRSEYMPKGTRLLTLDTRASSSGFSVRSTDGYYHSPIQMAPNTHVSFVGASMHTDAVWVQESTSEDEQFYMHLVCLRTHRIKKTLTRKTMA